MILHTSIAAAHPPTVAKALAELMGGAAMPFPIVPQAWIAIGDDGHGTAIEVLPDGTGYRPGHGDVDPSVTPGPALQPWEVQLGTCTRPTTTQAQHLALTSPLDEAAVHALAQRHGWRSVSCDRGGVFRVTEFWLENRLLIEVATPADVGRYLAFMRSDVCAAMFQGAPVG